MRNLRERLLVCWYVLTKKEYMFVGYDRLEEGNSGAVEFDTEGFEKSTVAIDATIDFLKMLRV